jgi:hypothetical protein
MTDAYPFSRSAEHLVGRKQLVSDARFAECLTRFQEIIDAGGYPGHSFFVTYRNDLWTKDQWDQWNDPDKRRNECGPKRSE